MKKIATAIKIFLFLTIIVGIIYPLFIMGIAQMFFAEKANGSLIYKDNKVVGSALIGQQFDSVIYFSSRPSAVLYNPLPSGGSNYGLTDYKLKTEVLERKKDFIADNNLDAATDIPSEMLFASASGLDPHISPAAALLQVNRIAKARNFEEKEKKRLIELIDSLSEKPQWLCLGEKRINVLLLNLEVDKIR